MIDWGKSPEKNKEYNENFENFIKTLNKEGFLIVEDDCVMFSIGRVRKMKQWPAQLDTENWGIEGISVNGIYGYACGDWQMKTYWCVHLEDSGKIELLMFQDLSNCRGKKKDFSKLKKDIIEILLEKTEELKESISGDTKKLKKYFDEFNKTYFNNEIPDLEIKITNKDTEHSKGIAGSFNYSKEMKGIHSNKTGKKFDLIDLKRNSHRDDEEERAFNYFIENSYIELPKDIVEKGEKYFSEVMLHEMTHAWISFCSNSTDKDPHGRDFRKKIDEINKKARGELNVPYEQI